MKHVALFRGINVGGNNLLPMKELCALFERNGCAQVASYIQSGNVIFDAPAKTLAQLPAKLEAAIAKRFGHRPPIQLRSAGEMTEVVAGLPFPDPAKVFVGFLAAAPTKAALASLDAELGAPDRYVVRGREIYLEIVTNAARTKLTVAYFDKRLATVTTMRNWNTVMKLGELLR
jgi:uncharacterized protein (DUF1697 family)